MHSVAALRCIPAPVLDDQSRLSNRHEGPAVLKQPSRSNSLNDSLWPFCQGLPDCNEVRVIGSVYDPLLDASRYELGAVVPLDDRGAATPHLLIEHTNSVV